jgi:hypothetical protein
MEKNVACHPKLLIILPPTAKPTTDPAANIELNWEDAASRQTIHVPRYQMKSSSLSIRLMISRPSSFLYEDCKYSSFINLCDSTLKC